jgi:thiamine transport system permease protein
LAIPFGFLLLFYFYPLGSIINVSFSRAEAGLITPFTESLRSPSVRKVLAFTFWQASLSTIVTLLVGLPGAYLFARFQFRGKSILQALTSIPFILPTLVVAAAFNALLGPRGWVNLALMSLFDLSQPPIQFINTFSAIILAHVFYNTTIVLRMVGDFWAHIDPRIDQAAQVLGANSWQTLFKITLPLLLPAISAATLLIFIFNFTSFGVILILGGPRYATLEVEIYYQTISLFNLPLAATLSVLQLACTLGLTLIYTRLAANIARPLSLRPRKYTQRRLNTWPRRIMAGVIILFLVVLLITPLVALVARSFTSLDPNRGQISGVSPGFTLDFYRELTINRRDSLFYTPPTTAIAVSFGYATVTVILALALGLPAAWTLVKDSKSKLNRSFDSLLMLPLGTSAVTLGLGFIIALSHPPLDLRSSLLLIPIAHTLVAFPFVIRSLTPALRSIQPGLRDAAKVMGASPIQVFRHIDLPLIGRALLVAATFAFAISLGEFGATALIARPEYPTIPVMIYRFISQPGAINYGQALALSTLLMLATTLGMLAIERFRIADIGEF